MTALEKAKHDVAAALTRAVTVAMEIRSQDLIRPPKPEMGDLSFPCFGLAKQLEKNPALVAKELTLALKTPHLVAEIRAVGPYVNFFLDRAAFGSAVLAEVIDLRGDYGTVSPQGGGHVMLEYLQPNTHKEIHVGHLRNASLGLSLERLLRASGNDVIPVTYIGDVGAHVAKWLWYFDKVRRGEVPGADAISDDDVRQFGRIYVEATRLADADPEKSKSEISAVLQALERHDPEWETLWLKTRDLCLEQMHLIFSELGIHFERTYLESEVEQEGKTLVKALQAQGIAIVGEKGAIIVNLEDEGLGVFLVLKSDGTALYSTKELALAQKKFAEFPDTETSITVVDNRQSLYFKQFFATLRRMGFDRPMLHLGYEFVTLKEGAMSSRAGNIVTYEAFRDAMTAMVAEETHKRHPDWTPRQAEEAAWMVAEGAMKFGMLKQDNDKPITFDMAAALDFNGFTGPYVQYAHARLSSILGKAGLASMNHDDAMHAAIGSGLMPADGEWNTVATDDAGEFALLRLIADLPEMTRAAAETYRPSLMAQYVFELAQAANQFYRDVQVLTAEGDDRSRRLAIVAAARIALANGLHLLGMRAPEEM